MNLEFGIQKYHEILLIFHGFVCFFPATHGKSDKFNPRKPSWPLWFTCSMIRDAARLLRYLHLQIHANSPKLQRRAVLVQAAHQPFNVRLTQSTCGRKPGGCPKKSNRSKNQIDLNFSRKKKRLKKRITLFWRNFFGGLCNSHPKRKVGRFDFHPELLGSFWAQISRHLEPAIHPTACCRLGCRCDRNRSPRRSNKKLEPVKSSGRLYTSLAKRNSQNSKCLKFAPKLLRVEFHSREKTDWVTVKFL